MRCWRASLVLVAMTACASQPDVPPSGAVGSGEPAVAPPNLLNMLTEAERAEGWTLLFDGRSFAGWRGLGRKVVPAEHWTIEDGAIRKIASGDVPTAPDGQPIDGGDIITVEAYDRFELRFDWRVAPGANSGIKYNVSEAMSTVAPPVYAALGFEYQILDDDLHPDAKLRPPLRRAAGLYDLLGSYETDLRPVGEFNEGRIVFDGHHGEHWVNGGKVVEYDLETDRFRDTFAVSKYAPILGFADVRPGHIVLQDHGDDVWFRNLAIRRLP